MAFHQMELHPDSWNITTFAAPNGLYRYKLLLFGVKHGGREIPANCVTNYQGLLRRTQHP